ncbi:MAG: uroporphyrinogen decarboxylase family protein [Planctomycetota bacterium]
MTRRERFFSCMARNGYDRIPVTHHYGTPEFHCKLYDRLGVDHEQFHDMVEDVFDGVGPTQTVSPTTRGNVDDYPEGIHIGNWGEIYAPQAYGEGDTAGTYGEAAYLPFADVADPAELADYPWPSPDWYDYSNIRADCRAIKARGGVAMYTPYSYDFMNNIARTRGVTQTMLDIGLRDPVFMLLLEKRFEFHYETDRRVFEAADGEIDVVHMCEDLGGQNGPLISMATFDELFAPYIQRGFDLAHKHGALTMMHICGGVRPMIPRLIELGLDILDVVQVAAKGMEIEGLCRDFGADIAFCGSMCVQSILAQAAPESVAREVQTRLRLFEKGGLILGPSHDIQVHTPVDNVIAMYQAAGYLTDL